MDERIRVVCPACGKSLTAKLEQAGKLVKCPSRACGQTIRLPLPQPLKLDRAPSRLWPLVVCVAAGLVVAAGLGVWILTRDTDSSAEPHQGPNDTFVSAPPNVPATTKERSKSGEEPALPNAPDNPIAKRPEETKPDDSAKQKGGSTDKPDAPPPLPAFAKDLEWSKETKETLEKAIADYLKDQVSAYLAFEKVLQEKGDKPTVHQREWLQKAADGSRERVITVLKQDFGTAADALDLHAMHLVMLVADKVRKDSLADKKASFDKTKSQVVAGKKVGDPLWQVTKVKGELLDDFSEGYFNRVTLTPKEGGKLLRVKARVENVSKTSDVPYAASALRFGDYNSNKTRIKGPAHIIQDNFIVLLPDDSTWIPCEYVCESCTHLRGFSAYFSDRDSGRGLVICGGTYIPKGNAVELDVVFSVPKKVDTPRLLVLGSAPVEVEISK